LLLVHFIFIAYKRKKKIKNKIMKENKLYQLFKTLGIILLSGAFAWFGIQMFGWVYGKYQNYRNPIEPGREMILVSREGNPFEKHDTLFVKVLEVKGGYVLYEESIRKRKDTTSSQIGYLRNFTPVGK
jgi:hypothetical protein